MRYSAIAVGASMAALAVAAPSMLQKRVKNFQWFGVNESGAEFGATNLPGVYGTDYTWPVDSSIDTLVADGLNIFRIPILMERITPTVMTGPNDPLYLGNLTEIVNYITNTKGAYAVIDSQNFGRYYGNIFTSTSDFQTYWQTLAGNFASNSKVVFDCNNEFHDEPSNTLVAQLDQACIDGVRASGATSQYIFVEGTSYTGAWTWISSGNGDAMGSLTDPSSKIIYEMHQYLDSDGSGTSATCVNSTIGSSRLMAATAWLKANDKKAILGEFAGGSNSVCEDAVTDMLTYMVANNDVWMGGMMWGGGPWWGDYIFSMEPPSGTSYVNMLPLVLPYI